MGRQRYPYAQVGRPAQKVPTRWEVLRSHRCKFGYVGLIQRTRTLGDVVETSFAVARSKSPVLGNGALLRPLEAVPYAMTGRRFCKVRDPEAWHSVFAEAEAKLRSLRRRGGY